MTELKQELESIFEKYKSEYKSVFDDSDGLQSKVNNGENFGRINNEFVDELISKSNAFLDKNPTISKTDVEDDIKELFLNFSSLMLNPFD